MQNIELLLSAFLVIFLFFICGVLFHFLSDYLSTKKMNWSVLLAERRSSIYRYCGFLGVIFIVFAFFILFFSAYIQNISLRNFFSTVSVILFAFFFASIEGLVFNLGISLGEKFSPKRKISDETGELKTHFLFRVKTIVFILFYIGFVMLLSYPLVLLSNLLFRFF